MRGNGFPVPPGGARPLDMDRLWRDVESCLARSVSFVLVCDGDDVTLTIADNREPMETLFAFAGLKEV